MKISNNKHTPEQLKRIASANKNIYKLKTEYKSELDPNSGTLILQSNKEGWLDTKKTYYIHKNGSGRKVTAWETKNYIEGTFNDILNSAKDMYNKNNSQILSKDNIIELIEKFENKTKK